MNDESVFCRVRRLARIFGSMNIEQFDVPADLGEVMLNYAHGWCFQYALAVWNEISGIKPEFAAVTRLDDDVVVHVALVVPGRTDLYFDAYGLVTERDLLVRYFEYGPFYIRRYHDPQEYWSFRHGATDEIESLQAATRVVEFLEELVLEGEPIRNRKGEVKSCLSVDCSVSP